MSLIKGGEGVDISDFGGEGTGMKSMKQINWRPNQKIRFEVKGNYVSAIEGYNVRCTIRIGDESHLMAVFQRPGEGMQENFEFGSFIEDFDRDSNNQPPTVNGCQYQRSATFMQSMIRYNDNGKSKNLKFDKALFSKDNAPNWGFCKDWSCAGSTKNSFTLTTGGSRLGAPETKCNDGDVFEFDPTVNNPRITAPLKTCIANTA